MRYQFSDEGFHCRSTCADETSGDFNGTPGCNIDRIPCLENQRSVRQVHVEEMLHTCNVCAAICLDNTNKVDDGGDNHQNTKTYDGQQSNLLSSSHLQRHLEKDIS